MEPEPGPSESEPAGTGADRRLRVVIGAAWTLVVVGVGTVSVVLTYLLALTHVFFIDPLFGVRVLAALVVVLAHWPLAGLACWGQGVRAAP
jgi:hypothetical protein